MTMLKKSLYILAAATASLFFSRCTEPVANPAETAKKFMTIFDDSNFDASYVPLDMEQTPDGGYLVLSARRCDDNDYSCIHLLKADKNGEFVSELTIGDSLVNAVGELTLANGKYYFACMRQSSAVIIASIDPDLNALTAVDVPLTYPAAVAFDDNAYIMLSYNSEALESVISRVTLTGNVLESKGYSIGVDEGIEEPIIEHFFFNGRKYPFAVGKVNNGLYYFNGFYDYTFSLAFTNINADDPLGVVAGQHENGGFSALAHLNGSTFATARFHFGENFLLPRRNLSMTGNSTGSDVDDYPLPELVPNAKIKILRTTVNEKNVIIYGSDTKAKQIGLYFYDEASGTLIGSHYLGFSNPYEFATVIPTTDGGLAVCGTTYLAGRFPRICIFKLSKEEVDKNAP